MLFGFETLDLERHGPIRLFPGFENAAFLVRPPRLPDGEKIAADANRRIRRRRSLAPSQPCPSQRGYQGCIPSCRHHDSLSFAEFPVKEAFCMTSYPFLSVPPKLRISRTLRSR